MSEIKFACPGCQQHIACDTGYSGMEISCPACKAKMIVPQLPGTPPPPPRLSIESTAPPPLPPPPSAEGRICQNCGAGVEPDAMICTQCGTNLQTGQPIQQKPLTPSKPGAKRPKARKAASGEAPWYKSVYPYLLVILAILGGLYYFGRTNPTAALIFWGTWLLYGFGVYIYTIICAWKDEGALWGILCIVFWIVAVYYVFFKSENPTLQALCGVNVLLGLATYFI